jgi:coatomer protein complex subunit gamma
VPIFKKLDFAPHKQSLNDEDDETRDRAVLAVNLIERAMEAHPYSPPLMDAKMDDIPPDTPSADDPAAIMILPLPMSFDRLERSLRAYKATPIDMESSDPVTFSSLPIIEETAEETEVAARAMDISGLEDEEETEPHAEILQTDPAAAVYAVPELASLGHVFRSCPSTQLTESESEYIVHCVKHIFVDHVVLQFVVENTIEDQRLDNVTVAIEGAEDEHLYEVIGEVAADPIAYGQSQNCFTVLKQDMNMSLSPCSYHCELHFTVVTLDDGEEVGESIEEEYALDSLEILPSDYMAKVSVPDFRKAWEDSNSDAELLQKFELPFKTREAAVASLLRLLGMKPCDGTGTVSKKDKAHMLHLSGVFVGGHPVLVRAQIASVPAKDDVPSKRVILKIAVRSDDKVVSQKVLEFIS